MTAAGEVRGLTVWPVKSMGGGTPVDAVAADRHGLAGDRVHALLDRRPLRDGHVVSARSVPGVLRWSAAPGDDDEPVLTAPDGRLWHWSDDGLREVLSDDLGVPVDLAPRGRYADLVDSVLVTTQATHDATEAGYGAPLDDRRWRTNLHLALDAEAFAEDGWEGRALHVGDVVLRLLHPCKRCTIPTWEPGGARRDPALLRWFLRERAGVLGINARVEVPGVLEVGAPVRVR
ncbi:MAG TPA: MOSC N-terminal beta barrel domain-containing protein [Mycobacteriales bacterium]|nr:MOSC N-terminal beta barrel domain-containing protein [Mycobacteriales bacterium]